MKSICGVLMWMLMSGAQALEVKRVDPPFWWVGMHEPVVQLMLYGRDLGAATARSLSPQIEVLRSISVENPNYLFVDLKLARDAAPGVVRIELISSGAVAEVSYDLRTRIPDSASRIGFSGRDVILNLVPDRFANGDPANDRVDDYRDKLDRSDIHHARHGGDLQGIIDHLDDISAMGYTTIWPTPLTESNQPENSYHGYAATDTYRIDPRYGSNALYCEFVERASRKGIGVIQDIVLNHVGSNHWWVRDPPTHDWFTNGGKFTPTSHARTTAADPYATQADRDSFTQGWFVENMPDMNQRNPLLANYQIQNSIWWVEFAGLSGLRVDTYGYSDHAFLAEWSRRLMAEYPNFNIVGEEWSSNPVVVSYWQRGKKNANGYVSHLPSLMDFPLREAMLRALVEPESLHTGLQVLYDAMVNDTLYPEPQNMVLFEGNHDVPRLFSALREDLGLYKLALVYVLTAPRIPQMYYGTDILMTSPTHRDDGAFRRDYPGGWAGDSIDAFSGSGLSSQQTEAKNFLKKLLNWRRKSVAVHVGGFVHFLPRDGAYVYFRNGQNPIQRFMVILNKSESSLRLAKDRFKEMLSGYRSAVDVLSGATMDLTGPFILVEARTPMILELH